MILELLRYHGAPMEEIDKLRQIAAGKLLPFRGTGGATDMHRWLLTRDLGFDPGPLSPGLRTAAKALYHGELYGGPVVPFRRDEDDGASEVIPFKPRS